MFAVPGFNVGDLVVQPAKEQIKKRKHEEKVAATAATKATAEEASAASTTTTGKTDSTTPATKKQKKEDHSTKADASSKKDSKKEHRDSSTEGKKQQHQSEIKKKQHVDAAAAEADESGEAADESAVMLKNRPSWNRSTKELRKAKIAEEQAKKQKEAAKKQKQQKKKNGDNDDDDASEGSAKRNKRLERKLKRAIYLMKQESGKEDLIGVPIPEDVAKTLTKKEQKMLKDLIKVSPQSKDSSEIVKAVATGKKASAVVAGAPAATVTDKVKADSGVDAEARKQQIAQERQKLLEALARMDSALEELEGADKEAKPATKVEAKSTGQEKKADKKDTKKDNKKQQQQQQQQEEKKQAAKKEELKKDNKKNEAKASASVPAAAPAKPEPIPQTKLTKLQEQMKKKLAGGKFRFLNEQLYTTTGAEAFELFQAKPELFDEYHEGFRAQVELWPTNPVDVFIAQLKKLPKGTVIADLGCGDAMIGATLTKQKVLSFDLVAKNERVTACDIAHLPLEDGSVDVAVFCLSLMGTDFLKFLNEAYRVLKPNGQLKVAEVVSRFTDVDAFVEALTKLGFELVKSDDSNKMFITFDFVKASGGGKKNKKSKKAAAEDAMDIDEVDGTELLKPCIYKKR